MSVFAVMSLPRESRPFLTLLCCLRGGGLCACSQWAPGAELGRQGKAAPGRRGNTHLEALPITLPRTTRRLPESFENREGECQPLAWTVMFPLWSPVWWMSRSLPIRRLRYAPAIFFCITAVPGAAGQSLFSLRKQDFVY